MRSFVRPLNQVVYGYRYMSACCFYLLSIRVRPKFGFGFGYGAETDLTHGFGLVSATAKMQ